MKRTGFSFKVTLSIKSFFVAGRICKKVLFECYNCIKMCTKIVLKCIKHCCFYFVARGAADRI